MTTQTVAQTVGIPEVIERFWRVHQYAPTVREVASMIDKSVGFTHAALLRLQAHGSVSWTAGMQRTLRTTR